MDLSALKHLDVTIQNQAPLCDYTTFRLGGQCPTLITCRNPVQLEHVIQYLTKKKIEFILIGGGSNLVVSDKGIHCCVVRYVSETPLIERQNNDLIVSGSTWMDDLVKCAAEHNLKGLNNMTGIPGTVGGAVVGNAGAFGKQIGDVISMVYVLDRNGKKKAYKAEDLKFSYRNSIIKQTGDIIVFVRFSLAPDDQGSLKEERSAILDLRRDKHPALATHPSAGSFFRNIEPTSEAGKREAAGWFLDQAGAMSLASGGAKISEKHANIIVRSNRCSAQDVFHLSEQMSQLVKDKFNIDLVREVRFVGKFDGMPADVAGVIW